MIIRNTHINGFKSLSKCTIFLNGDIFYVCESQGVFFNLPKGKFEIVGEVERMDKPLKYLVEYPPKERDFEEIQLEFYLGENPNKASIDKKNGKIFLDRNFFQTLTPFERLFILNHEVGHFSYSTELYCDIFASNKMLENGYNPSQCLVSSFLCLGNNESGKQRKKQLADYLNTVKYECNN